MQQIRRQSSLAWISVNHVEQYGRRNNKAIFGIPDDVADDELEDAVTSIMEDVDVIVQNGDI